MKQSVAGGGCDEAAAAKASLAMSVEQITSVNTDDAIGSESTMITKSRSGARLCIYMVAVLVILGLSARNSTAFQTISEPGIDLIILLDQSGSMSNPTDGATDPDNLRIDATRYLIEYLAFDNNSVNPDRVNRVAVIGFGSPTLTDLLVGLTTLNDANNVTDAQNDVIPQNLGATSFIDALKLVRQIFPEATDEELETGQRRRMIVIVTDGGPDDPRRLSYGEYFAEIKSYYETYLGKEKFPVYIVGVDEVDRYWSDVEGLWEDAISQTPEEEDRAFRVAEIEEVRAKIVDFLCPFLAQSGTERDCRLKDLGPQFVDPYANIVRFSFFKYDPNAQIQLYPPGGTVPLTPQDSGTQGYSGGEESYQIPYPEPGCWLSERIGQGRVDVFQDTAFSTSLDLIQPEQPHPNLLPLTLRFSVSNDQGVAIQEHPDYPVSFQSVLTAPDGTTQTVEIVKKAGVDGIYESTNYLPTPLDGTYTVKLQGFVDVPRIVVPVTDPDDPTRTIDMVCTEESERELFSSEFDFEVLAPGLSVTVPAGPHLPYGPLMELEVAAMDGFGAPLDLQSGLWLADARLRSPSGIVTDLPTPDLVNGRFLLTGPFVLNELGSYTVNLSVSASSNPPFFEGEAELIVQENTTVLAPPPVMPIMTEVLTTTVQLRDLADNAVDPDPNFPLRMEAALLGSDNSVPDVVRLEPVTGTAGTYRAVTPWVLPEPGDYTVRLTGYLKLSSDIGAGEMLAFETEHALIGSETLPYFRVIVPNQANPAMQEYELHGRGEEPFYKSTPMQIHVQLLQNEQPTDPRNIFREPAETLFTAEIFAADGSIIGAERPMTLSDEASEQGLFTLSLDDLVEEGDYKVKVHLAGTLIEGSDYEGFLPDTVVPFRLYETDLYKTSRIAAIIGAIIAGLALLALIAWIVYGFLPPYPTGRLVAKERGVGAPEIAQIPINPGGLKRKKAKISGEAIPARLQLDRIEVKRVPQVQIQGRRRSSPLGNRANKGQEEVIEIVAFSKVNKDRSVATGKLYSTRAGSVPCSQSTDDGKNYEFKYER